MLLTVLGALHTLAPSLNVSKWLVALCATYLLAAVAVRLVSTPRAPGQAFDPQWVPTIGVDLVAFAACRYCRPAASISRRCSRSRC